MEENKKKENIEKKKTSDIKSLFTIENLLCFFIIICPILDVASFLFRNYFKTNISTSTFSSLSRRKISPLYFTIIS